jgi:hypothetical protein
MVTLTALWLPILLSAVIVFVASSVIHMMLPFHRADVRKLADEDAILDALRKAGVAPGQYMFPCAANPKEMSTPEMQERFRKGPVGILHVMPSGPPMMPKHLAQWFVFCLAVGVFAAYLAGRSFGPGAEYLTVFRHAGAVSFLGYVAAHATDPIWKGGSWAVAFRHGIDGLVYSLLTAGVFAWLWP